jgi:hypothetical protein
MLKKININNSTIPKVPIVILLSLLLTLLATSGCVSTANQTKKTSIIKWQQQPAVKLVLAANRDDPLYQHQRRHEEMQKRQKEQWQKENTWLKKAGDILGL